MTLNYNIADAVTSLIYASAVNVILTKCIDHSDYHLLCGTLMSLFVFIDWLSRIGVPLTFPDEDQARRGKPVIMVAKAFLEIIAIFFLVAAVIKTYLPSSSPNIGATRAFGIFLGASFCWNVLILWVMTKLRYRELMWQAVAGSVFDAKGSDTYTEGFKHAVGRARIELAVKGTVKAAHSLDSHLVLESMARSFAQLLGHHITWVNFVFCIVLLTGVNPFFLSRYSGGLWFDSIGTLRATILALLLLVPSIFYFFLCRRREEKEEAVFSMDHFTARLPAILTTTLLILFYATFTHKDIFLVMLVQHAAFGVFLQIATHTYSTNAKNNHKERIPLFR